MTTNYDDLALIKQYFKAFKFVADRDAELAAMPKYVEAKSVMEGVKAELQRRMLERKQSSSKTEAGTAYISQHVNVTVENMQALVDWAKEDWNERASMLMIKAPIPEVRDYMAMHEGKTPPGIAISDPFTRCNIRGPS